MTEELSTSLEVLERVRNRIDLFASLVGDMPEEISTSLEVFEEEDDAVTPEETACTSVARFEDLNLSPELLKGLYVEKKFERPRKIQSIVLPMILTPKDVIVQGDCGCGKTTCCVLCMLSRIDPKLSHPQALCVSPTRELALQFEDLLLKMGKHTGITAELSIPNIANYVPIARRSRVTSHVIIGTASTVNKLIAGKKLDTSGLKMLIFDDADHMLIEGGSKEDSVRIMKDIHKKNPECKVLVCITVFNDRVKAFVDKIANVLKVECTQLFVKKDGPALDLVKQYKVNVPDEPSKIKFIINKILELGNFTQTIIFVRTKESSRMLHKALLDADHTATNFHGALTQKDKDSILMEYKEGFTQHLITTDVHARGFDLTQANLVINYDLPPASGSTDDHCELYLHRIGRVGRHHNKGAVFNFLCGAVDNNLMEKIEKYNKNNIVEVPFEISNVQFEDILKKAGL